MPKLPISILILTKNSAAFLENALLSASFAKEIIILDDNSTDNTLSIAKKHKAKIIKDSLTDFAAKRNLIKQHATQPWLFYLDADERIPSQLQQEIANIIKNNQTGAYQINRLNIFWGKPFCHGGWSPDWVIRFFHKDYLTRWQGSLHEQPVYKGTLKNCQNPLIHLSHSSLEKSLINTLNWSWIEAKLLFNTNHPKIKWYHFISAPTKEFIFRFIKKQGYKDGLEGFLESIMQAISKFITYERLWELQNGQLTTKYQQIDDQLKNTNFDLDKLLNEFKK